MYWQPLPDRPESNAVARLAFELRELRDSVGLSIRELANLTHYHFTVIGRAQRGLVVPTWEVTVAYTESCCMQVHHRVDLPYWRTLWVAARHEHD